MNATNETILTTWKFSVAATAEAEINDDNGEWINYTTTVTLTDHQGFERSGGPVEIRHTAYIRGDGLEQAEDAHDFDAFNDDLRKAYGVFADSQLRELVLAAMHFAAERAWRESR